MICIQRWLQNLLGARMKYKELIKKYQFDDESLLKNNIGLDKLSFFSRLGLGIVEILDFNKDEVVLYVGKINIQRIKYISDKVKNLYVLKKESDVLEGLEELSKFTKVKNISDVSNYRFDKIIVVSDLDKTYLSKLREYKSLLKEEGNLVVAFNNSYGLNYILGGINNEFSLSYDEALQLCKKLNFEKFSIYYPFPSYELATTIYSDLCSPSSLGFEDIRAYNYPKYSSLSPDILYTKILTNNDFKRFSNSYLLVFGNKDLSTAFIKYNRNRIDEYAIKTKIVTLKNTKIVRKEILHEKAKEHIKSFRDSYEKLKDENKNIIYLEPKISEDFSYVDFSYIEGENLELYIAKKIKQSGFNVDILDYFIDLIITKNTINLDCNFNNFVIKNNKIYGIDYEWISSTETNNKYFKYRILNSFYKKYKDLIKLSKIDYLSKFDISKKESLDFDKKESDFQQRIHKNRQKVLLNNYFVDFKDEKVIQKIEEENEYLLGEIKEKEDFIFRQNERIKLTDNHVRNLENVIKVYEENNVSLLIKVKKKIRKKLDLFFPKASKRRKILKYFSLIFRKPIYLAKLLLKKEGRNRIKGDFNLCESYLIWGKLEFKEELNPLISIIIPCYNQVEYTYNCLVSIKNTLKEYKYEVILADDVSKDATKNIETYVSGIKHIRNEKNLGFLENCNNASKYAKGKYLYFLNNDTRVCEKAIYYLVKTLEENKDVGLVGSKLIYEDGRLQEAGGIIFKDASAWNYGRFDDKDLPEYNYVREVDYISGASIMLSKKLWDDIGGFDSLYTPAYCEDSDLAFEVRKRGFKVIYQPKSEVIHYEGISNGTDTEGEGTKRYQIENTKKLRTKWKDELEKHFENNYAPNVFRARERNFDKKVILFIDHYVPTFDKDAGSRTSIQYLELFLKKGYVVKFIGDNFLKEEPYTSYLLQKGIEVLYGLKMQNNIFEYIKENEKNIHLVYINRPNIANKYINFIKKNTNLKIIYYGHDLHFLRLEREKKLDDKQYEDINRLKSLELSVIRKADIVYYPSKVEYEYIKNIDKDIEVKVITPYIYSDFSKKIPTDFSKREGLLFVGSFSHRPNVDALFFFLNQIWPLIKTKLNINLYIVGSNANDEIKKVHSEKDGIIFKGFVSDRELEELYLKSRISIVPLRYGAGVKGKLIESLYYGLPVISTKVGVEGINDIDDIVEVEDEAKEFATKLINLYQNINKLKERSLKSLEYIKKNHSIEAVWDIIKEDFVCS